jgi:phytoene synthase
MLTKQSNGLNLDYGNVPNGNPELALALSYAPAASRAALSAVFALDEALAQVLRTTREPMVGQMRLTWWHGALAALDTAPPPAQPVLQALAESVLPRGVAGAALTPIVEGWEELLAAEISPDDIERYAQGRGTVFTVAGAVLGAQDPLREAGEGWALVDLAWHSREPDVAALARELARLALADLALDPAGARVRGSPGRVWRALRHRLTGR